MRAHRPLAAALLAAALAAGLSSCAGSADSGSTAEPTVVVDAALGALATDFLAALVAQDFAAATAMFDDTMAAALPTATLASTWEELRGRVGSFEKEIARRQEATGGYDAVVVTAQFEHSALNIRVVFDAEQRIAGLFFQPVTEAWEQPPYAGEVSSRDVTVGERDLPGTLTTPVGEGPWPAVVLVHGSGPNDRDETIGPNKPFRDLALGLASRGIAVLTYDKRTFVHGAEMAGDLTVAEEVVDDAVAAVALLRADPAVDPQRVFVLGHSLGGMLAPRIADEADGVAGLVLLAGAARPLEELILEQSTYLAERDGTVTAEEEAELAELAAQIEALRAPGTTSPAGELLGVPASYWLDLQTYDPTGVAARLDLPLLVLQGERDYQVTMTDFALWQDALAGRDATLRSFPGLNHLMMPGEGPSGPEEYDVPGHVAPEVIDEIAAFLLR